MMVRALARTDLVLLAHEVGQVPRHAKCPGGKGGDLLDQGDPVGRARWRDAFYASALPEVDGRGRRHLADRD
jgi:hypothetical protein